MNITKEKFTNALNEIIENIQDQSHIDAFFKNMKNLIDLKDKKDSVTGWLFTYFLWSEIGSEEDLERYYFWLNGGEEDEEEDKAMTGNY